MMLRLYRPADRRLLTDLFYNTVHAVCAGDYTSAQLDAWAPKVPDAAVWDRSLRDQTVLVAEEDGVLLGFGAIRADGYLDLLYVHKDHQRRGVASVLCDFLEMQGSFDRVTVQASQTARPFLRAGATAFCRSSGWSAGAKL